MIMTEKNTKNNKTSDLCSLSELARDLGTYKSKLTYYVSKELIKPITVVGKMQLFNRKDVSIVLEKIEKLKESGKTLEEIKEALK
jgi:DNA-binding transcriptional MerR regulator